MRTDETEGFLDRRLAIIEKLAANTRTQRRFIAKRQLTGLRRLLRERDELIGELAAAMEEGLRRDPQGTAELAGPLRTLRAREREVLELSAGLLQAAALEKSRVAAELRTLRAGRSLKNHYGEARRNPGRRLNVKG